MKVITLSPEGNTASEIVLDEPTNNILIKNFSDGDLFFKFASEENYARVPSGGYQSVYDDSNYITKIYYKCSVTQNDGVELCII